MTAKPVLVCDIETYRNYWLVGFKRLDDGKVLQFELSERSTLDRERLKRIMLQNQIITFNGLSYDVPLIFYAIGGATNAQLKQASDRIILGDVKYWDVEKLLGLKIPFECTHIDLIEPQPNAFASLKTLNGRLHGRWMQDLPVEPDATLTHEQMDELTRYNVNDLDATELLYEALIPALELRAALGEQYKLNLLCKSDAQCGEAIIKRRVEQLTNQRVEKVHTPAGTTFPFRIPDWMNVEHPELRAIVERLRAAEFIVQADGKVRSPDWLKECFVTIGGTTYAMGIGGLHSTESACAVHADWQHQLVDADVGSYYPAIILNSGLYPRALGRDFLEVFRRIRDERIVAKRRAQEIDGIEKAGGLTPALAAERSRCITVEKGLKIALNGCFGKLGSQYSILYAPHLMIAITLGGQMALLMLIDRAERAGIKAVSANTDGVVFRCPVEHGGAVEKSRLRSGLLSEIIEQWEADTGFELEMTEYRSLYSSSVNHYIALKPDGKSKAKGPGWTGRHEGDIRTQLMKNPSMEIVTLAVMAYLRDGTPLEQTIRAGTDVRDFLTVVNVRGGATWRSNYLGKVVRYIWSRDGDPILYKKPHPSTGNHKKVPKSDGCRPVMTLPDELPIDIDYERYVAEAEETAEGHRRRPPRRSPPAKVRVLKRRPADLAGALTDNSEIAA
jgi:hypothetical protein